MCICIDMVPIFGFINALVAHDPFRAGFISTSCILLMFLVLGYFENADRTGDD